MIQSDLHTPPIPTHKSYLFWAVLSTSLCCFPFGIIAIIYANKSKKAWNNGDLMEAEENNKKTLIWLYISFGCGVFAILLAIVFKVIALLS